MISQSGTATSTGPQSAIMPSSNPSADHLGGMAALMQHHQRYQMHLMQHQQQQQQLQLRKLMAASHQHQQQAAAETEAKLRVAAKSTALSLSASATSTITSTSKPPPPMSTQSKLPPSLQSPFLGGGSATGSAFHHLPPPSQPLSGPPPPPSPFHPHHHPPVSSTSSSSTSTSSSTPFPPTPQTSPGFFHPHMRPPHPPPPGGPMGPHHPGPRPPGGHPNLMEMHKPRMLFRFPRVVPNQKEKFDNDDLMKKHLRETEVRYTAFRDRPMIERQAKFIQSIREGHLEIAFIATGLNLVLSFDTFSHAFHPERRQIDFEKEPGKVHIKSPFIMNGICVLWRGHLDIERLDGVGTLEFDEETAKIEDIALKEQVEAFNRHQKDMEEAHKLRQRHIAAFMEQQQQALAAIQQHHRSLSSTTSSTTSTTSSSSSSGVKLSSIFPLMTSEKKDSSNSASSSPQPQSEDPPAKKRRLSSEAEEKSSFLDDRNGDRLNNNNQNEDEDVDVDDDGASSSSGVDPLNPDDSGGQKIVSENNNTQDSLKAPLMMKISLKQKSSEVFEDKSERKKLKTGGDSNPVFTGGKTGPELSKIRITSKFRFNSSRQKNNEFSDGD